MKISLKFFVLFCTLLAGQAMAATCTAKTGAQNWDDKNSWAGCGNNPPKNNDLVIIPDGSTVTLDKDTKDIASLTVASGGVLLGDANNNKLKLKDPGDLTNNGTITLNTAEIDMKGNLVNIGTLNAGSDKIKVEGNFSNSGTFNAQTSEVEFSGSGVQTISGNVTFYDLKVDNGSSNGLLLNGNVTVSGSLSGDAVSAGLVTLENTCPSNYTLTSNGGVTVQNSCPGGGGPIADYRFDEISPGVVSDSSGNSLNGTATGGITVGGAGKVCNAYNFNGSSGYVAVSNNALLNQTKVTVMAWVRHGSAAMKNWEAIIAKGDSAYRLHLNGGCSINTPNPAKGFSFGINGGCSNADINSGTVPGANTWYHVVGTYDGASIKIYLNGVLMKSAAYAGSINSNTFPLYIGDNSQNKGRFWSGDIDEVKIYSGALTGAQIASGYANENAGKNWDGSARVCPVTGPDHLEIQSNGTGLTCAPSTLTIRACADAACTKLYTGGVSGTLSATGTPTVNWDSATGGATGAGFVIPAGSSSVTKNVQVTSVGSVVFGVTSPTTPAAANATTCNFGSPICTFTSSNAGFVFAVPNHVSEVLQTVNVSAVKTADNALACVPAFASVAKNVTFKCAYTNPVSGTLPVRVNGIALNAAGSAAAACDASGKAVSLSFGATGVASTTFQYADVGNLNLTATYTGSGADAGLVMTGSDSFIAAPKDFAFSAITAGPIKAGNNFSATVTARNNANVATPNFGKENAPEQVTVGRVRYKPVGTGTSDGDFIGSLGAFNLGAATANNLNWSEVGIIDLSATLASGSYLASGLTASGSTGATGAIGSDGAVVRFIPDHFDTAVALVAGVPMPCPTGLTCPAQYNGFAYSGQGVPLTITAKNGLSTPTTTVNYNYSATAADSFSKAVTLSAVASVGGSAMVTTAPGGGASSVAVPASSFALGTTPPTTLAYPVFTFAATPTVPTDVYWRAIETAPAGDGVSSLRATSASSVEGGVKVVSGRIRLPNAYGSERLGLPMAATVQYFDALSHWVTSGTDSATAFAIATPVIIKGPLVLANLTPTVSADTCASSVVFCKGLKTIIWDSANVSGSADITVTAPSWLQYPWTSTTATSPTARATFGIYKSPLIYRRENY